MVLAEAKSVLWITEGPGFCKQAGRGGERTRRRMSPWSQLVVVGIFLLYSAAYLLFVAWASESSGGKRRRFKARLIFFLVVALVPLLGLIPVLGHV